MFNNKIYFKSLALLLGQTSYDEFFSLITLQLSYALQSSA